MKMKRTDDFKDFEKLAPEERIKKLKEFESKRKKEIKEAERLMKESESQLKEESWRKEHVPIDQMKAFEESMLASEEEKEMFRTKHYSAKEGIQEEAEEKKIAEDVMLEEVLQEEKPRELEEGALKQYGQKIEELKGELYKIEDRAETGNSIYEDRRRAYEIQHELEDFNQQYKSTADVIQHAVNVGDRVIDKIRGVYNEDQRRPEQ